MGSLMSMDCSQLRASLETAIGLGWHCRAVADGQFLIVAPLTYPDGDHPELLVSSSQGGVITLSDFGSAAMRLSMNDVSYRTGKASASIRYIARGYGVHVTADAELKLDVVESAAEPQLARFGQALLRLASAMLQIDALRALQVAPREPLFATQLTRLLLDEARLSVTPKYRVQGSTGKPYQVTAAVGTDPLNLVFVQAVVKATATDMRNVDHTFRTFSDVNGIVQPERKISVLADPADAYDPSDIRLLKKVSLVATWPQRARLVNYLVEPFEVTDHKLYEDDPEMFVGV